MDTQDQPIYRFSNWVEYDLGGIIFSAPKTSGLYAIVRIENQNIFWIYIGKHEKDIRDRILSHAIGSTGNSECIGSHNPTHFAFVSIPKGLKLDNCEIATIQKYLPVCNDQHT